MSGVKGAIKDQLTKQSFLNWPVTVHEQSYLNHYKQEELVYLTADSNNVVSELDETKTYIIGGIVDRNRYKLLTLDKANKEGIQHAKLPIGDFISLKSSTVLTVNHVFEIVAEWYQTKDWRIALNKVIPDRKQEKQTVVKLGNSDVNNYLEESKEHEEKSAL